MFRLITFGGLALVSDDTTVAATATQRSRLALLAVLASAGAPGISRDKLMAFLWPDSDTERARHALKQAIYATRRDLHSETAIAGTAVLTLDPAVISSDVRDFDDSIARGDDATAVSLYAGPFLDGIFLRNAPEFERWCDTRRVQLQASFLAACERLARAASCDGRYEEAVSWWRRAAARDPLSGRLALDLMHALAESGDLTGALRYAAMHEELVRNELECAPDASVMELSGRLRDGTWRPSPRRAPVAAAPADAPPPPSSILLDVSAAPTAPAAAITPEAPPLTDRLPPRHGRWIFAAGTGAVLLLLVIALGMRSISGETRRTLRTVLARGPGTLTPRRIVVAPFVNRTGDAALDPLGALASDWIARILLESNFEVVDGRTSAVASRVVAGLPRLLRAPDPNVALAEETGAGMVLAGSYYLQGDSLQFAAMVSDITRGTVTHAIGPLRGSRDRPSALVEALATRVTAVLTASTDSTIGAATASLISPPSVEAFARTSHAWETFFARPADTAAVFAELARASAIDSAYSAPVLMRAYVLDVKERWPALAEEVHRLEARHATLGRAERAALDLFAADLRGDLVGRLAAARELARLSPGSADMALLVAVSACYVMRPRESYDALLGTDPDRGINLVSPMYWAWRAQTAHALQNYEAERFAAAEGQRRFPSAPGTAVSRARVAAVRGAVDELERLLRETSGRSESEAAMLAQLAGRELRVHGHPEAARRLFAVAADHPVPAASAPRDARRGHATAQYEAGRLDAARHAFSALLASDSTDIESLGRLGAIAVRTGDSAVATDIDRRLERWSIPYSLGAPHAWRAHLAALGGRPADAVTLLRLAVSEGFRVLDLGVVGLHDEGDFARIRDDPAFVDLIRARDGPLRLP